MDSHSVDTWETEPDPIPGTRYHFGIRQHLYPKRLLSSLMFRAARIRLPAWKNWQIRWFVRRYGVDMALAAQPNPGAYADFNSFFTRALRPECRPLASCPHHALAPADGRLSQAGHICDGTLLQAKGRAFPIERLLGGDAARSRPFECGSYATVYLAPHDYHRVHMPVAGRLEEMVYIPGKLFSVNPGTARVVRELFARNERVVSIFDTAHGPMAIVLVGAVMVGSIEQVWSGVITPPRGRCIRTWRYPHPGEANAQPIELAQGAEMGRFNMGSTVIVIFADPGLGWDTALKVGACIQMGTRIGRFGNSSG